MSEMDFTDIYDFGIDEYPENNTDDGPCNLNPNPVEVVAQPYIHSIICAFGLIGNILVVITYLFYKRTKTMTDVYLFNVALADLIFVASMPFIIYNEQHLWLMGEAACKILNSAYSINLYSGMLLLACISGDRYISIVLARRSFGSRSHSLVYSRVICSAVWISAVALTLPTLIYSQRVEEPDHEAGSVTVMCHLYFNETQTARLVKLAVPSCQMAVGFLFPFCVMAFCYSSVVRTLLRAQSSQRQKAIRVVLAVVVVFIACHLPYNVTLLIHTLSLFRIRSCEAEKFKLQVLSISRSVAYLHCCLNPILYAFVGVRFRSHFKKILVDIWCLGKKYIYSTRSSRITSEVGFSAGKTSDASNNMSSFSG
ncbi:C-C chemokine receptor type 6 [Gouania willdenowi]|uniref:C-C chemokine receptor type 6 n=1 Tax=Gouania willdenowi TaxID=441366 RepID=UPI00105621A7|nr:C-C chemokine receptor type 6 [Gouania willdenowi]